LIASNESPRLPIHIIVASLPLLKSSLWIYSVFISAYFLIRATRSERLVILGLTTGTAILFMTKMYVTTGQPLAPFITHIVFHPDHSMPEAFYTYAEYIGQRLGYDRFALDKDSFLSLTAFEKFKLLFTTGGLRAVGNLLSLGSLLVAGLLLFSKRTGHGSKMTLTSVLTFAVALLLTSPQYRLGLPYFLIPLAIAGHVLFSKKRIIHVAWIGPIAGLLLLFGSVLSIDDTLVSRLPKLSANQLLYPAPPPEAASYVVVPAPYTRFSRPVDTAFCGNGPFPCVHSVHRTFGTQTAFTPKQLGPYLKDGFGYHEESISTIDSSTFKAFNAFDFRWLGE
jgi:hypothetical protein